MKDYVDHKIERIYKRVSKRHRNYGKRYRYVLEKVKEHRKKYRNIGKGTGISKKVQEYRKR